jgi:hypothetical protein
MPLEVQDNGEGVTLKTTASEGEKLPIDEAAKVRNRSSVVVSFASMLIILTSSLYLPESLMIRLVLTRTSRTWKDESSWRTRRRISLVISTDRTRRSEMDD